MREKLVQDDTIKEFDRQVFESIVDYIVVGGYNEEGNSDNIYYSLQSLSTDDCNVLPSNTTPDACGDYSVTKKVEL